MSIANSAQAHRKIAVIGAGISGMGAAHMLAGDNEVTLFEAEPRLGGHARTIMAGANGNQPVDTGFIVFNYANYPHLAALFAELDVPVVKSNMSFGASINGGKLEYALTSLSSIFAQKWRMADPRFLKMLRDINLFNTKAADLSRANPSFDVSALLAELGTGKWFRDYYLTPITGAIWSTPTGKILDFPAQAMMQFMENHALLGYTGQHQWYTVGGGSIEYVRRVEASLKAKGAHIRLSSPIDAVTRSNGAVQIKPKGAPAEVFDEVVFATHSDISLAMLADASPAERSALGKIGYQANDVILHADASVMPKNKKCWASWVYTEAAGKKNDRIDLSYWMNSLQPIPANDPHFVTLNTTRLIRDELIYDQVTLHHPVYDKTAFVGQQEVAELNGTQGTWFCGAWMKSGFHEDGLSSAVDVVEALRAARKVAVAAE